MELDQVSINNISRVEINRSPTPDTPGAALAGSVNFVPRSAFDRSEPIYSYNVQWMFKDAEAAFHKTPGPRWGEWTRKVNPGFDVSAVVPVNKNFGFSVSAGYSLQYTPQPNAAMQWRGAHTATNQSATAIPTGTGTWFPDTTPDNPYLTTFSWRDSGKHTTRHSFATTVDWRPGRHDRLSFGFQYGMLKENFAKRTQTFTINRVSPGNWGQDHTEGPLTDPTAAYQRDAGGNVVRNAAGQPQLLVPTNAGLPYSELTLIERGYKARKEYLRLFPSLNASYNLLENLIGRVAYYQTVGRPDFNQYAGGLTLPNTEVVNPNDRITVNNVSIKAWQAETYMTRLEYYFGRVGQLSVAYFVRDYDNMFGNVTSRVTPEFLAAYDLDEETYGLYQVVTQFNAGSPIRMKGLEVDYRQALTFLPNWARGVQFSANYSSRRAKNSFDYFQDMNPFTVNWGLSLTRPKFNLRINENYRGIQRRAAVIGRGLQEGTYNYRPKRLYIDVSGEYYLRRSLGLFLSIRNIGGATEDTKIYGAAPPPLRPLPPTRRLFVAMDLRREGIVLNQAESVFFPRRQHRLRSFRRPWEKPTSHKFGNRAFSESASD